MSRLNTTWALAASNFLASFACGVVLAEGLAFWQVSGTFRADSILAYLAGATLSLFFILFLRPWIAKASGWLCIAAIFCGITLYSISKPPYTTPSMILFFGVLCVFFSLIFVSRTFRSDLASGNGQKLSWVELGYALGALVGLFLSVQLPSLSMADALALGIATLSGAALIDFLSSRKREDDVKGLAKSMQIAGVYPGYAQAVTILVAMTVGIQVMSQRMSVLLKIADPLVAFDLGTTLAPIVCATLLLRYLWTDKKFVVLMVACFVLMGASLLAEHTATLGHGVILALIAASALIYEVLALCLLERIGEQSHSRGLVSLAFGILAFLATISYWILVLLDLTIVGCAVVVGLCLLTCLGIRISAVPPRSEIVTAGK